MFKADWHKESLIFAFFCSFNLGVSVLNNWFSHKGPSPAHCTGVFSLRRGWNKKKTVETCPEVERLLFAGCKVKHDFATVIGYRLS